MSGISIFFPSSSIDSKSCSFVGKLGTLRELQRLYDELVQSADACRLDRYSASAKPARFLYMFPSYFCIELEVVDSVFLFVIYISLSGVIGSGTSLCLLTLLSLLSKAYTFMEELGLGRLCSWICFFISCKLGHHILI